MAKIDVSDGAPVGGGGFNTQPQTTMLVVAEVPLLRSRFGDRPLHRRGARRKPTGGAVKRAFDPTL